MYRQPVVRAPTQDDVGRLSNKLGLKLSVEEIQGCTESLHTSMKAYARLNQLVEPQSPVNYPRTPGYRPPPEENPFNAWSWKTDIKGSTEGILKGKTVGIKDNIAVAGVPMTNGSKIMEGFVPDIDATVVSRILDAGGCILGKTNCENLCISGNSFTSHTGPVLNPHDQEYTAGGSSSGSAALVASGHIDFAIGSDQGGSVRLPACRCGIVGLKPTHGLVPYTGAVPILNSIDHLGPMARNVYDCALLLQAIAGYDHGLDPRQQPNVKVPVYTDVLKNDVSGIKVGLIKEGFEGCNDSVDSIVYTAISRLRTAGVVLEDVSIPMHNDAGAILTPLVYQGRYEVMMSSHGTGFGFKGYHWTAMHEHFARGLKTHAADLSITSKLLCLHGEFMKENHDYFFYSKACNAVNLLTRAYDSALEVFDVLVIPTIKFAPTKLPSASSSTKELLDEALSCNTNTAPFNMTGHPVLTINAGFSNGLPVGLSIIGKHFDESTVLKVAHEFESISVKNGNVIKTNNTEHL